MSIFFKPFKVDFFIVATISLFLSACGGGSGGESGGSSSAGGQNTNEDVITLYGSVGDGPIVGANIRVFDSRNNLLAEETSDTTASYNLSVSVNRNSYPLILEASGGQDIVTNGEPDFTLKSFVVAPTGKQRANINPFSTLITETATNIPGGLTASNIASATQYVQQQMNFSFDQALMTNPVTSEINQSNIAVIIRSSEALGEMVRRTRDALQGSVPGITGDDVMASLSADLVDGLIDGTGSNNVDARIAAVSNIASAQVLIEVMTGNLNVNSAPATTAMNDAVLVSMPGIGFGTSVNDLSIPAEMITQTRVALAAAQSIDTNPIFAQAETALDNIQAGSQPADIVTSLPADVSNNLLTTLTNVAVAPEAELEQVNSVVRSGDSEIGGQNTAPTISGSPTVLVMEGSAYSFVPTASDIDGDTLTFTITNLPTWANFNTSTGTLTGTPSSQNVRLWNDIIISVNDGNDSVSLPAFSITVNSTPNTAPIISGTPAFMVIAGGAYNFIPTASDTDGDNLIFRVTNLPSWANFSTATGSISGMPGSQNVGINTSIVISVSDGTESVSLPAFSITVNSIPNTAPVISGTPAFAVTESAAYSFIPTANDGDGDALSFTVSNLPSWANFSTTTGALTGIPSDLDAGVWNGIVISVNDGTDSDSLPAFSITVNAISNTAPIISGTPAFSVTEDATYSFIPTASDSDGDALTFTVTNLPSWASFNTTTGTLTGIPTDLDVGVWNAIVISVNDGTDSDSLPAFSITVNGISNTPPTISGTPASAVEEGSAYNFVPTASDADGDSLNFSVVNLPSWANFNTATGALTGTPGTLDVGISAGIVITVNDGVDNTSLPSFSINVTSASPSFGTATLSWLPPTENTDGSLLTDLAGYKIYYGTAENNYTSVITVNNPGIATYVVENLPAGSTYYFVITSVTVSGLESEYSSMGSKTIL